MTLTAVLRLSGHLVPVLIAVLLLQRTSQLFAASAPKTDRLKIGYASITGNRISLWTAQEK